MNFKDYIENKIEIEGGFIEINKNPQFSPRKQSVTNLHVPEEKRNKGIGTKLVAQAKKENSDLGAQVSSIASLKVFYKNNFRNPENPTASLNQHIKMFQDNGETLFLAINDKKGKAYV
jgi:GNAT superfamily N-acetyltransferase